VAALDPAVAVVRTAVRSHLRRTGDELVLVACSGGADSLALAAAAAFVGPRQGWRVGLSTVDHQLQPGSAERAESLAGWALKEGFDPVIVRPVAVAGRPGGPEAAAREARYEALVAIAREHSASRVLLGHTREDQAETVLLALLRGAGARGLAGMPVQRNVDGVALVRPLLGVSRAQTRAACAALGLQPWEDPHNGDPAFRRTHARALLAALTDSLGPGVVGNLARTATLAGQDAELLDALAADAFAALDRTDGLSVDGLALLPDALRGRVLHAWALTLGCPPAALGQVHVEALDALVTAWHGQGAVGLPGGIGVARRAGHLVAAPI
jgi:tRNA(Ile)-lysidine synthase